MTRQWVDMPIENEMFRNLDEDSLRRSPYVLENAFINEARGHTRAPGLRLWKTLPGGGSVYLHDWRGDLVAVTSNGRTFRIGQDESVTDCTNVTVVGSGRVSFAKTDDQLLMAAGGPIVQLSSLKTELLSSTAPNASFVGYLAGFALAVEPVSQLFYHSSSGAFTEWDPIDVFAAESNPDNITSMVVTEFGEILLAGPDSIEQFEAYPGGDAPFFRRWSIGEGVIAPYSLIAADNGIWGVNRLQEFSSYQGGNAKPQSLAISKDLEATIDWSGAWAEIMHLFGQKFIVLKAPKAMNSYGTMGVTWLFDYRAKRWSFLYGWDSDLALPAEWPGNSYRLLWGQHHVGGKDGKIYRFDNTYYQNDGLPQLMYWRSANMDDMNKVRIDNLRFRLKRGSYLSGYDDAVPAFQIRHTKDNRRIGKWQTRFLGKSGDKDPYVYFGQQGTADVHRLEYRITDDIPVEVVRVQALVTPVDK